LWTKLKIKPFELLTGNPGVFKRKKTNILWLGIEGNIAIFEVNNLIRTLLQEANIPFYDKLYVPHVTLGRRVQFNEDFTELNNLIQFETIKIPVNELSLMASVEENGKMNGVAIYKATLD
jgi:2'-5' RNA ligase